MTESVWPSDLLSPGRHPLGISAVLLPFRSDGHVDEPALAAHIERTAKCGLVPAVNMDTGFGNLLDAPIRRRVLEVTRACMGDQSFLAGAFCPDRPGDRFDADTYARRIEEIAEHGGTPVVFQSFGLITQSSDEIVSAYASIARMCDQFIAFELTTDLAPFGAIYDPETYEGLLGIPQCIGAKHSSFRREPEWQRLRLRNELRPDFRVFTGNDFAIDMIMYGSDYLLGLSTFAPDAFALRDACWASSDPAFFEWNDVLQYLGSYAFRAPGSAYKHTAARFLKLRGWISCDATHPQSAVRDEREESVLREILERLERLGL